MMKTKTIKAVYAVGVLAVLLLSACGETGKMTAESEADVAPRPALLELENVSVAAEVGEVPDVPMIESQPQGAPAADAVAAPAEAELTAQHDVLLTTDVPLTDADIAGLIFMREEEKLAHDLYTMLYDAWGLPVLQNIAASEQMHMDSVLSVMAAYGLTDPAAGLGPGEFRDATLQNLYNDLIEQGLSGLVGALRAGAAVEEIDILDLDARIGATDNSDVTQLYTNLRRGSENHLRAFVSNLARQDGEAYAPQYLPEEAFMAIMAGETGQNGQQYSSGQPEANNQGTGSGYSGEEAGSGNEPAGRGRSDGQGNGRGYRGGRGG